MLDITFLGHAGFLLSTDQHTFAVDPFLTDNPHARHSVDDIRCDSVVVTHGHFDHFSDALDLVQRNRATLYAPLEIISYAGEQGVAQEQLVPCNPGGQVTTDFGFVALTQAVHGSSWNGRYMGPACGVVVRIGGATFYHTGDTALFRDMELIGELYRPDVAAICAGDQVTMGPAHAAKAAEWVKPRYAIPIHHTIFPGMMTDDISAFTPRGVEVKKMDPGDVWHYGA